MPEELPIVVRPESATENKAFADESVTWKPLVLDDVSSPCTVSPAVGVDVPMPIFPLAAMKREDVAVSVFVLVKYGRAFAVPVYKEDVAMFRVGAEPRMFQVPLGVSPRPKVGVVVAVATKPLPAPLV